ncbi:MAG: hypothetical protein OEV56_00595, partial [Dehalococcoidia bacterium]|nr:hypothetical protein [Dehalococcoidia bacterium]
MTWIGGIFSKVNTSQEELRKKLTLMIETACPTNECSAIACTRCISSILDDVHGQALVQVSIPTEGTPSEHVCMNYREKPALIYDGHLHNFTNTGSKLSQVQHIANKQTAQSLADLLVQFPGNLEQKVKRALLGLDGDYALAISDIDRIVISRDSSGTRPLYFAGNTELLAFASNKKPLWKIGLDEVRPLRAGMFAVFDHEGVRVKKALPLRKKAIEIKNMARVVDAYEKAFCSAMRKRLAVI